MKEEILSNTKEEESKFDEKYASRALFLSFKYSQGDAGVQERIFRYLHYLRPQWKITDELEKALTTTVTKMAEKYLATDTKHVADEDIKKSAGHTVLGEAQILRAILNDDPLYIGRTSFSYRNDKSSLIRDITIGILSRDEYYLTDIGRPRVSSTKQEQTSNTDRWMSQLCYYGFLGHATGLPEYDQMFRDIKEYAIGHKKEMMALRQEVILNVVGVWNMHHPEEQVSLD